MQSSRSKQSAKNPFVERPYKLFAVNFHGKPLKPIRDEFTRQVKNGLRRKVFVVDVDEEIEAAQDEARRIALESGSKKRTEPRLDVLAVVISAIQRCQLEYENVTRMIEKEITFDLVAYWMKHLAPLRVSKAGAKAAAAKAAGGRNTKRSSAVTCPALQAQEHNIVGKPRMLSRRKYIADEPEYAKNFIIIIGSMGNKFYIELLQRNQPLQAIVHFLPGECGYDILLPHPENKQFVLRTLEEIHAANYELRQKIVTKPIGIFKQELPVISRCLAQKLSPEIYDQLCWYMYDCENTYRQYLEFYIKPYQVTNVEMPASASVKQTRLVAESLSLQGHFLLQPVPAISNDVTTIVIYLESLINTLAHPDEMLSDSEMLLLTIPMVQSGYFSRLNDLVQHYRNAFASVLKIGSFERIVIEHPNTLLLSLVAHLDEKKFHNIFLTCLEYNLLRKYVTTGYRPANTPYRVFDSECDLFYLPIYAKFFASDAAVKQNLARWFSRFDKCSITEIYPDCRLYHFKNKYNEIIEDQELMFIPTRLCFRDFTLFILDDFKDYFSEMERLTLEQEEAATMAAQGLNALTLLPIDFDEMIFVRPNSLSARLLRNALEQEKSQGVKQTAEGGTTPTSASKRRNKAFEEKMADHPGLKGYNLDDTWQEIIVKKSKYHFDEGVLQLYEERWCFTDMNKTLHMKINRCSIHLLRPRRQENGISRNIRFTVNKDISVRVLNTPNECAKVVVNYPNGLSIFHHETYAEQMWNPQETFNNERRRIYTPYGAVIGYYNDDDLIVIMRYNGEVYKLYQYEFAGEEEEAMDEESERKDATSRVSSTKQRSSVRKVKERDKETTKRSSKVRSKSDTTSSSQVYTSSLFEDKAKTLKQLLVESIDHELRYLAALCEIYNLQYLHLAVTTSTGNIIHITHKGRVYKGQNKPTAEWHDYFANESYAMRADEVRMIWTKDALKCYHKDGTLITTQTVEGIQNFDYEFDITQSSSHIGSELTIPQPETTKRKSKTTQRESKVEEAAAKPETERNNVKVKRSGLTIQSFLFSEGEGEEVPEDTSYVTYCCDSFLMQHKLYAEVYVTLTDALFNAINIEITTIHDIRIQIFKELPFEDFLQNDVDFYEPEHAAPDGKSIRSRFDRAQELGLQTSRLSAKTMQSANTQGGLSAQPSTQQQSRMFPNVMVPLAADVKDLARYTVKIYVGDSVTMQVTDEDFQVDALMQRLDTVSCCIVRDPVNFRIRFDAHIVNVFRELVETISQVKVHLNPKTKEFYFLERVKCNGERQGFRFFDALPVPTKYNFTASNVFTELQELKTITEQMTNNYPWFASDMKKFPRFPPKHKTIKDPKVDFPLVLTATTYIQIPRLLTSSDEIQKFLDPFDDITFKRSHHHVKDALEYYMRPFIRAKLAKLWSKNNWTLRHSMHRQRMFIMQQRKGLYHAMLKHKVYPKYHQFVHTFNSHVKNIEFFDFVSSRCQDKSAAAEELREKLAGARTSRNRSSENAKSGSVKDGIRFSSQQRNKQ